MVYKSLKAWRCCKSFLLISEDTLALLVRLADELTLSERCQYDDRTTLEIWLDEHQPW